MANLGWDNMGEGWMQYTDDEMVEALVATIQETGHIKYAMMEEGDVSAEYDGDVDEILDPQESYKILQAERICNDHELDENDQDLADQIRELTRL